MFDSDGEGRSRTGLIAAVVIAVLALGFIGYRVVGKDDGQPRTFAAASVPLDSVPLDSVPASLAATSEPSTSPGDAATTDSIPPATDEETTATEEPTARSGGRSTTTTAQASPPVTPASDATTTTTDAQATTPSVATPGPAHSYPTLPDGSPQPILAVFDVGSVILSGFVPSQAAMDRLTALAVANARDPAHTTVDNFLQIDPTVPADVGVRVVEKTSQRFPEGSAEVVGAHGLELDRVANVMKALPNVTVLVIGHADQRGDDLANYKLSADRATAVVNYLVGDGVQANRLSSRAVGEADLLTLDSNATALALNRRTEFVFYGLLVG
jgi:outer membrane protein OmpA-like peptidoglycan-associated protein